jgi:exopolyphosphatase/guanosine-5'-triphosphate,3'-diphosphate pyrophosphatase
MACATAALREARNGEEVVETVRKRSGLDLQIISGTREAEIVCANHAEGRLKKERSFLYVDVGGGSTDLTFLEEGRSVAMRSFPIGTLRILKRLVRKSHWEELRTWLSEAVAGRGRTAAIGSGGNINKIFKLAKHAEGKPLGIKRIRRVHAFLNKHTLEERIRMLNLRPDRADVIVPAARIYMAVMKWAGIRRIHVPQIGLADGMIHILYEARRAARKDAERDAAGRILTATRG